MDVFNAVEMDAMVLSQFPLTAQSCQGGLRVAEHSKQGISYVVAADGVYMDVCTSWMIARIKVGQSYAELPYGKASNEYQWLCTPPPLDLWKEFLSISRSAFPNECAALMVWNSENNTWRLAERVSLNAGPGHIHYENPSLGPDEVGIVDIHSHGVHQAFFSKTDNIDDFGSLKLSVVIGQVHREVPQMVLRLHLVDFTCPVIFNPGGELDVHIYDTHPSRKTA